ncbi:hypothetical protein [Limnoraphis robusta]|jgi:hypothetical protein|uniref:hypothetical protein n=1 Tax=Limnoraphis robusta TaxID=1118279 RepID=UPI001F8AABB3|nr:hypothetical protein [Limnoraphis robusta]MCG5058341.1 hypothetical protein [Limnoraphis sp. WC205]MEA5500785.1 hypothetical protein [Limnoraphis robusta BA-68 BA1]MEA5547135.1 hypothetical protein [Limnoraphis robusta CCNP1324]
MLKLKHRKIIFLILIALLAGGSMAVYSQSEINFWVKTVELVIFQQCATVMIYLTCFGVD